MSKRTRVFTVLLAAAVLFAMLSSAFYIAIEAGHDCTGEECPICCQISACENTLKSVGSLAFIVLLAAFAVLLVNAQPGHSKKRVSCETLVLLKVKLSD